MIKDILYNYFTNTWSGRQGVEAPQNYRWDFPAPISQDAASGLLGASQAILAPPWTAPPDTSDHWVNQAKHTPDTNVRW